MSNKEQVQAEPELLDVLSETLGRYDKNLRLCSKQDLEGKYAKSFLKLKEKLAADLKNFLMEDVFAGMEWVLANKDAAKKAQDIINETQLGKKASHAAFVDRNIDEIVSLAFSTRSRIVTEVWSPFQALARA